MSTLADELLNDFEDSGSEGEGHQQNGFLQNDATPPATNGRAQAPEGSMVLDEDEEDASEDDGRPLGGGASNGAAADVEDEEEAKAKVEKMQLSGVDDVRSVARLMKTLEPVLQVCVFFLSLSYSTKRPKFTSSVNIALTFSVAFRKFPSTRISRQDSRLLLSARSKTIPNTISLHSPTLSQLPSTTRSSSCTSTFAIITQSVSLNWKPSSQILSTMQSLSP